MITRFLTFDGTAPSTPFQRLANPSHHILVLDDDDDIREICVETLVHNGYHVDAAGDGEAGWKALQARKYDLLITDHEMPKLSGLDLVKRVCSSGMPLAVIVASGSLSPGELKRYPSIPIAAALPKPFSPDELLKTVQHVLCGNDIVSLPPHCLPGS